MPARWAAVQVEQLDKQMEEQKSLHSILQAQIKRQDKPRISSSHGAGDIEDATEYSRVMVLEILKLHSCIAELHKNTPERTKMKRISVW